MWAWDKGQAYLGTSVQNRLQVMCISDVCNAVLATVQRCQLLAFIRAVQRDFALIVARGQVVVIAMKVYRVYLAVRVLHGGRNLHRQSLDCFLLLNSDGQEKNLEDTPSVHLHTLNSSHVAKAPSGRETMNAWACLGLYSCRWLAQVAS